MPNIWGKNIKLSIFGESHGPSIGIVIGGLPAGKPIDMDRIMEDMSRRAPGRNEYSTKRKEPDIPEVQSGIFNGKTTGAPICCLIRNSDARSGDYSVLLRPGHADMTALMKYAGYADMRGGGHFSGRLTAPLVFAGSIARQLLMRKGISVFAKIAGIGGLADGPMECVMSSYEAVRKREFPVWSVSSEKLMRKDIEAARNDGDSLGGIVEAAVFGLPPGLGEPFFRSAESVISSMLFSIPAVKGVEFGDGFGLAEMRGSESNDAILVRDGRLVTETNHNGGILGGITNGMPLTLRAAIKPTPSISKEQRTVDGASMRPAVLSVSGRHDPCIVPRAVPVVECAVALCILDLSLDPEIGGGA